jgi:hypothetical protein
MPERYIFGPDDAEQFTTVLNAEFDKVWPFLSGSGGGGFTRFYGSGRLVESEDDSLAPEMSASPSLNLVLPDGFLWWDGALRVLDGEALIGPLPASFEGYISLAFDEDGEPQFTTASNRAAMGSGTLAYVETDAEGVTLLDVSESKSDVILSLPLLQARQRALAGDGEEEEGGGGGGGAAEVTRAMYNLLKSRVDAQDILIAELSRQMNGDAPTTLRVAAEAEVLRSDLQRVAASQTHDNPALAQETTAAIAIPGRSGFGETAPDGTEGKTHYSGGNWSRKPRRRSFG